MPTPGWRGLCNATRRIRTNGAKLEQGLGKALPNKDDGVDSNFSSIENLWPQVDTCFRPFRATLKISEVEPQCTLNFAKQNVWKGKAPARGHRSHRTQFLPLFCSGVVRLAHRKCEVMAQYLVQTAYVRFKVQYEESRTQCGHYNLLLSSTRITLWSCTVNN